MDSMMPLGFFENTQEIYAEIASYPVVPPEKLKQYWNVYTTTFRRLFDPSAFRLENFWWHVWGSEKLRNLSGPELARLFEEFSTGPTFVPLPAPTGRLKRSKKTATERDGRETEAQGPAPGLPGSPGQRSTSSTSKKGLTPSSSRPPPAHPILKKSRGPSSSGPRPTARFASPPTSGEEAIQDLETASTSTAASAVAITAPAMPPPPLPPSRQGRDAAPTSSPAPNATSSTGASQTDNIAAPNGAGTETSTRQPASSTTGEKAPATTGRKFVVATAASKRRPVVVRRTSSQTSAAPESGQRNGQAAASKRSGSKRSTPTPSQLLGQGSSSSQTSDHGLGVKANGKRRAKPPGPKRTVSQATPPMQPSNQADATTTNQPTRPASPPRSSTQDVRDPPTVRPAADTNSRTRVPPPSSSKSPAPLPVAGFVIDQSFGHGAPMMVRSRSNNSDASQRFREPGVALLPTQATSSVAMVTATARGQFDSETMTSEPAVPEPRDIPDKVRYGSQPSSSILETQLKPTPPNPTPPIPFGRSKSELTLLLARGRKDEDA
ncbi:uncharacterized protein C8A04DRAFT_26450 [Dichotomopilus funicola]|uniref:Uncharacterized protein n=1 Tax=Dichotomopilus funicola TaxID=1934379 RepID=A0AAN6V6K7_9PEZI|nr:hypothetical protein C8A04DRAFT_26450 [Dichotomopilus funicola]